MGYLRPATPGFIVTFVATILLIIVSFCVPYLKSVFFLRASISQGGVNGSIIFGTLGYCLELSNGTLCSKPSVGYELDINSLVGNDLPIQIPQVVVKWITTALVLHIAALIVAAGSALFGLLAHVREMSMTCCSTFFSGFAAVIALVAFIFDLILFFVAKARISAVGSAQIGSAVWLTLAAWILLFFSGCFYSCGRCCISNRPPKKNYNRDDETGVRREASNKRRLEDRKPPEVGLPEFPQLKDAETEPLTGTIQGDAVFIDNQNHQPRPGYLQAPNGTSAAEVYYHPQNIYPPQRQPSVPSVYSSHASSGAPPITPHQNNVPQAPPDAYGSSPYGYATPSRIQNPGPYSTGLAQGPDYPQYNRSSPSPHQNLSYSLLDPPPMRSASNPPIPLNQPTANPYVIHPSPPPQQNLQPGYSGYTLGGNDYETRRPQPPPKPYVIYPSPPPQESHHSNHIPGYDYEVRGSPRDSPPLYTPPR